MATKISTPSGVIFFYLDDYMKRNNLSVQELADLIDKSYNQALNIKNGRSTSLSFDTIATLCNRFNCQPGQLFEYQNISKYNIKTINEVNVIQPSENIKKMSQNANVEVTIHVIFYQEEDYILYGSPELDFFSELPIDHNGDFKGYPNELVLTDFKKKFKIKKQEYKNIDDFMLQMQRLNHWYFDEEFNNFIPMPLDYYKSNYYNIQRMLNKPNFRIFKTKVVIVLHSDEIEFGEI